MILHFCKGGRLGLGDAGIFRAPATLSEPSPWRLLGGYSFCGRNVALFDLGRWLVAYYNLHIICCDPKFGCFHFATYIAGSNRNTGIGDGRPKPIYFGLDVRIPICHA